MMSDMKVNEEPGVYTVRDLNRRTAEILAEAARLGSVTIRSRSGERFVLQVERKTSEGPGRLLHRISGQRSILETLGHQPPSAEGWKQLDEIIAGEE